MSSNSYGMKDIKLDYSDEQIARLFGHEAAEDEQPDRLREYYFKNELYDQIAANLPLRLLVGHKGIGKSAMFQVLRLEFEQQNHLTVSITPDDIASIREDTVDMLELIRAWRTGLKDIIVERALSQLGNPLKPLRNITGPIINFAVKLIESKGGIALHNEKEAVIMKFLEAKRISVFIDDLDRGWEGKKADIRRVSAMLNAVRDLSRENPGVSFRVSLRTDVYYLYRTSDESTDKVEGSVVWHTWNNFQILALLAKRIITFFGGTATEADLLKKTQKELTTVLNYVFSPSFDGYGKWEHIPMYRLLTSLIRKRPRDLVKLRTSAAKEARRNGASRIGTREFSEVFESYSLQRLQDTIIEFRSELPEIEKLLTNMKPTKDEKFAGSAYLYENDRLYRKVQNILQNHTFSFANGVTADFKALCAFMYKIGFLTARKDLPTKIVRKYFEDHRFLMNQFADFGFDWEVHPAYRWALQPEDALSVMKSLAVYDEDGWQLDLARLSVKERTA